MAKALISIDYTEDFVAEHGKLTAGAPAVSFPWSATKSSV